MLFEKLFSIISATSNVSFLAETNMWVPFESPIYQSFRAQIDCDSARDEKKDKKTNKKNQAAQDKKPNEASGRKITQDALQSPHTTAKCHFTQSFTADTKPTRSTMVPYCKGRKGACYCEKKTTCNIYLCYIILICRRSLHFWYQQRKTLSFCRSH